MESIQSFARRAFIAKTNTAKIRRRLREETSSSENADTEGASTLQITAKNMQETELLAGFNPRRKYMLENRNKLKEAKRRNIKLRMRTQKGPQQITAKKFKYLNYSSNE